MESIYVAWLIVGSLIVGFLLGMMPKLNERMTQVAIDKTVEAYRTRVDSAVAMMQALGEDRACSIEFHSGYAYAVYHLGGIDHFHWQRVLNENSQTLVRAS